MFLQRLYEAFVAVSTRLVPSSSITPQVDSSPPTRLGPNVTVTSLAQARSRCRVFSDLSLDLLLEVMTWCGPHDLLVVQGVCRTFRLLLLTNRYIWRLARANLELGFPLPIAAPSEEWFVRYALGGGPCTVCRRPTQELPYSYSLGIRLCSASCSYYLLRACSGDVDGCIAEDGIILWRRPDDVDEVDTLMYQATPYLEGTTNSPMYRPSAIHDGLAEFNAAIESGDTQRLELVRSLPLVPSPNRCPHFS
ncbi:hypothetical protein B0H16DRAFT_286822 [Mycena metata]|uniref:F-box domain-containing protein n=1 Tax=Mycena metata TaxID=1033252 RepID=A0AAD7MMT3_9AGAR|nr:hypothetical protein B0H16DRAFT_286822 [Mycena metata]